MTVDLILKNTKVYTNKGIVEAGLAIDNGRIFRIAKRPHLPQASSESDLKGYLLLPGMIDSHVHLRDQQLDYKEDFLSGTAAAAAGGVTLALDMPTNKPVTMDVKSLRDRMNLAKTRSYVNVAFYSAFPEKLEEIPFIVREGALAFKLFLSQRIGGLDIEDDESLLRAFNEVKEMKVPIAVHAEDKKTLEKIKKEMQQAGREDVEAYVNVHSPEAENKAVERVIQLVKKSQVQIHFCHLASVEGLDTILTAKNMGLPITCEVTPHHLLLSVETLKRYGMMAIMDPPLRAKEDAKKLWKALKSGFIDILASDHAPHTREEKETPSVWETRPGIPGLETTLPLLLTQVNKNRLTIANLVRATSEMPAKIFQLKDRGSVVEGYFADFVVVDTHREYRIDSTKFYSKARFSPFDGWKVKGKPIKTFVNGELVMDEGEIVGKPGTGHIVRGMGEP